MNRRILLFFFAAVFLVALLCQSDSTYAQSSQSTYWRYDAPDRLSHLAVGDIDGDGIDEFVIAAGGSEVVLVGADGIARWSIPYRTDSTIYDMAITNLQDEIDHTRQIILLTDSGITALDGNRKELFNIHFDQEPSQLHSVKLDADAADAVVVAFENGDLELYDGSGEQLWELSFADANIGSAQPLLAADDLDRDGIEEIVYTYFTDEGFSKVVLLSGAGDRIWERSNSGNITAIAIVEFDPERPKEIALATSLNRVFLHSADGSRRWTYRSPNKPITALEPAILDGTPVLLVGTSVGKTIAYDDLGRRVWEETYSATADRPVQSISVSPAVLEEKSPVALSILLGPSAGSTEAADLILTDANGRRLEPTFPVIDSAALSRLTDVNQDGLAEVLLAGFATAELLDPGVGVRHYSGAWDYRLDAGPQAFAIVDLDRDNEQEILIGTDDGTVHALKNDGTRMWTAELGGIVSNILVAYPDVNSNPYAAVIHNDSKINDRGVVELEGWLELLNYDGRQLWSRSQPSNITAMVVGDINRSGPPEIIVGTSDGLIIAYSLTGDEFWRSTVSASVDTLTLSTDAQGVQIIAGTGANKIDRIDNKGVGFEKTAEYLDDIVDIELLTRDPQIVPMLIAAVEDGTVRGLTTKGNQIWEVSLPGTPLVMYPADDAVLVGTDDEQLVMVDIDGEIVWRQLDAGIPTSLYWGDLNGDITADVAVGNRQGDIRFITADGAETWDELNLDSAVVAVSAIGVPPESQADLVAITDNGIVQLFKSSANRPPLLINPRTEVSEGSYNVSVSVIDVEGDPVHVILELYDPDGEQWVPQGEKTAVGGFSTLFWSVDAPVDAAAVRYRYQYDDGSHSAVIEPAAGPPAIPASPILLNALAVAFLAVVGAGGTYLYFRQARSPENRARKLYGRIKNNPSETLSLINEAFNQTGGSAFFLLNLANTARQDHNQTLTSLVDGLYLLSTRPEPALRIIDGAMQEAAREDPPWRNHDSWQRYFHFALSLVSAPTVTELTLLRSRLKDLLSSDIKDEPELDSMDGFVTVLNSLHDSLRVDLVEDRLLYLSEAIGLLKQFQHRMAYSIVNIEHEVIESIINRLLGLVRIELEEMHGRAELDVHLLTKRLAPEQEPQVAIEISNTGKAPAENLVVVLQADPSFNKSTQSQLVPILSPGRKRQVQFTIDPEVVEPFRVVFSITYEDRQSENQTLDFADMVHLLPPVQEFVSTLNPYSPGMPLRHNSQVFFGREDLFEFIRDNTGRGDQRNVLVLIGQRRTGKTSVLLQLDRYLEPDKFPVYVDCQSLGVSQGMPAFFHDLAWIISEALAAQGYELDVPRPADWQVDPAGMFQREFIPKVQSMLPLGTKILLVFDEFEVFENLVRDEILPKTLFTFLRHMMQHSEGLGFIFAGTHRLEEMGSDYWSVLFNIALYKHIGYLEEASAIRLIRDPVAPQIVYDDLAVDKILRVTAGHPYFLQLVCYSLVNQANNERKSYVTISDVNAALTGMLRLGEVHFAYLWQRSSFTERALLSAASRRLEPDALFQPLDLVHYLSQYGVYLDPAEVTAGLHRLVEREIMSEIETEGTTYFSLRIGLVGLWVSQNKSMSKLYESQNVRDLVQPPNSSSA